MCIEKAKRSNHERRNLIESASQYDNIYISQKYRNIKQIKKCQKASFLFLVCTNWHVAIKFCFFFFNKSKSYLDFYWSFFPQYYLNTIIIYKHIFNYDLITIAVYKSQ